MFEADRLASIGREILDNVEKGGQARVKKGGKVHTLGDIKRQLQQVGVNKSDFEDFVRSNSKVNDVIDRVREGENRGLTLQDFDNNGKDYKYVRDIVQTATDSYHGRNKMFRPESWNSSIGRLIGQYSYYPMNFSLQTTQRRVRQPIQSWSKRFGDELKDGDTPVMKLVWDLQRGDAGYKRLKKKGLSDEAINELPVDAYTTAFKTISAATGLTFAMNLTKDGFNDVAYMLTEIVRSMITGEDVNYDEMFEETRKNFTMNPYAPKDHQRTLGDLITDPEFNDISKFAGWFMSIMADMGTFGKWGSAVFRDSRFQGNTPLDMSPVGRELQNVYDVTTKSAGNLWQKGGGDIPEIAAKGAYDFIMPKIPVVGSYSLLRSKTKDAIFNKPKNKGRVQFDTGRETIGTEGMTFERY
jgi:hypothetical protein